MYVTMMHVTVRLTNNLCKAAISFKLSNLLIFFCGFDLSCPILEKEHFIKNVFTVLYCLIK